MGLNDQEIVVLSGAHTLGRAYPSRSGFGECSSSDVFTFTYLGWYGIVFTHSCGQLKVLESSVSQESRVRPLLPALMRPDSAATLHSIRLMTSDLATLMCLQHASNVLAGLLFVVHKRASGLPVWSDFVFIWLS